MQCPTCGTNTPGTLGRCSHCNAPIDQSPPGGPVPLGAPVPSAESAQADSTMVIPRPAEASATDSTMVVPSQSPSWAAEPTSSDPEATAAWKLEDEPDTPLAGSPVQPGQPGGFGAAPPPPAWADDRPAGGTPPGGAPPAAFGTEPANESIVPDSWFAQPRKPGPQPDPGPEMWTPQPAPGQAWGAQAPPAIAGGPAEADATVVGGPVVGGPVAGGQAGGQVVGGPSPEGAAQFASGPGGQPSQLDQTRFDQANLDQTRFDQSPVVGQGMQMPPGAQPGGQMGYGAPTGGGMMPAGPGGGPGGFGGPLGGGQDGGHGATMVGGYPQPPPPRSGGQASKPLIISVCALVAIALVAVGLVMWPDGKKSPSATPSASSSNKQQVAEKQKLPGPARAQAAALNELLNASADTRGILTRALVASRKCQDLPQAINGFRSVAQRRQNQLRRTQTLKVDKLQNGERLRAYLRQAFQSSLQVDQVLLNWAQRNQRKCKGKPRPDAAHVPGRSVGERRATSAKQHFVTLWNPVARSTGQPVRRWTAV